jgi:hypothetical protein
VAVDGILEVPDQRMGCGEPIKVPDVASLCAVADQYKEVKVRAGVKAISFSANRTQGQQGEGIIAARKFSGQ